MLCEACGSARDVYDGRDSLRDVMPDMTDYFVNKMLTEWDSAMAWAENELEWCEKKDIQVLAYNDERYPARLRGTNNQPLVLFYRGSANLNARHILSFVGTRTSTPYGHDMTQSIVSALARRFPDLLIISGLAYGIDIESHKAALDAGLDTIGVLAHGLDTIYPAVHRSAAVKMLGQGGLLTEYPSHTPGDRQNFLQRNRIVAGMSDATVVVESKAHGGSLVTARLANENGRNVFAVPGRVGDDMSEGCNRLLGDGKALMLMSADDIIEALGWMTEQEKTKAVKEGVQTDLFAELTNEERLIAEVLSQGDCQLSELTRRTQLPVSTVSSTLFQMEMKQMVRPLAGSVYHFCPIALL